MCLIYCVEQQKFMVECIERLEFLCNASAPSMQFDAIFTIARENIRSSECENVDDVSGISENCHVGLFDWHRRMFYILHCKTLAYICIV